MRYVCTGTRSERPPYLAERAQSKYGLIRGRQPCARKRRAQYGYMIGQVRHSAAHKSPEARFTLAPYLGRGSVSRKRVNSAEFQGARRVSHSRSFFPKRKKGKVGLRCCFTTLCDQPFWWCRAYKGRRGKSAVQLRSAHIWAPQNRTELKNNKKTH